MSLAYDASAKAEGTGSATLTFAHTCTGTNLCLIVGAYDDTGDQITGVTYNGVAMTFVRKVEFGNYTKYLSVYYLLGPATGANNVIITRSTSTGYIGGIASSYTDARQSSQPDASNATNYPAASQTAITTSVTTVGDNSWIVAFGSVDGDTDPTGNGVTIRQSSMTNTGLALGDTAAAKTPPGAFTVGFTSDPGNAKGGVIGVSIADVAAVLSSGTRSPGGGASYGGAAFY